jgi:hypothetical protein
MTDRGINGIKRCITLLGFDVPAIPTQAPDSEIDLFTTGLIDVITTSHDQIAFVTKD